MGMKRVCDDLQAEIESLDAIVSGLDEAAWNTRTLVSTGWSVRDQIAHLGGTDRISLLAATDPDQFKREILGNPDLAGLSKRMMDEVHMMSISEMLDWWRQGCRQMLSAFRRMDPKDRVPWFGPSMSALSNATARIMEIWAHGQDIIDGLGMKRPRSSDRIEHVAHMGIQTRNFSYRINGKEPPIEGIYVELRSPSGGIWKWGDEKAENRVCGDALEFCFIVVRRRHLKDTNLVATGHVAAEWLSIAQAYAGKPDPAPEPGTRPPIY